jgi:protein-S-isoprenylcysteine O-methyltransferase Ste14
MAMHEEFERQGNWLFKYRSFIPILILLIGAVLYIETELNPDFHILKSTPYEIYLEIIALLVGLTGFFIRVYTVGHTPQNTSGRNTKVGQVADTLNISGMYAVVRHPLYLGNFLMWFGPAMLTGNMWFLLSLGLFFWIYYERIMYAEEQFLRKKFGTTYLNWAKNVPPFIPKLRNFKKPDLPFSWKKVLKKEKNGLFALFLIFCLFDVAGELIKNQTDFNYFFISMSILTGIGYLILKFLKNKTQVLNEVNR